MSSISTLEVAWENKSLWPSNWRRNKFLLGVAWTNKLEFLKWIREEKKCEWDSGTIHVAANQGNLEMVKYCVANECPIDACVRMCRRSAEVKRSSRGTQISYARISVSMINMRRVCWQPERPLELFEVLARNRQSAVGHSRKTTPECVQYLFDNNCPLPTDWP